MKLNKIIYKIREIFNVTNLSFQITHECDRLT